MATRVRHHTRGEGGFTLIEVMVVVLIIAILLAIAIPTFLAARTRANNRAAQSQLRNAITVELVIYADDQEFTADTDHLRDVDSSLNYTTEPTLLVPGRNIFVSVSDDLDTAIMGTKSSSGRCFWMRVIGTDNAPRFAEDDCGTVPPNSDAFTDAW